VIEKRHHSRKPLEYSVNVSTGTNVPVEARCSNVSLGGMFVETNSPEPYGTKVMVHMQLPGLSEVTVVETVVRWTKPGGMGLQFGLMGARETHALVQLIE
jgi:type IV pilus assembly protein PilZ